MSRSSYYGSSRVGTVNIILVANGLNKEAGWRQRDVTKYALKQTKIILLFGVKGAY